MAVDCTIVCVHCQNKWNINTVRLHFDDFSSDLSQCDKINDILLGFGNHTHACVSTRRNNIILYFFPFIQLWFCIKWAFDVDYNAHLYILTYLSMFCWSNAINCKYFVTSIPSLVAFFDVHNETKGNAQF